MLISAFGCSEHRKHVVKKLRSQNESLQELNKTFSLYKHKYRVKTFGEATESLKVKKVSRSKLFLLHSFLLIYHPYPPSFH